MKYIWWWKWNIWCEAAQLHAKLQFQLQRTSVSCTDLGSGLCWCVMFLFYRKFKPNVYFSENTRVNRCVSLYISYQLNERVFFLFHYFWLYYSLICYILTVASLPLPSTSWQVRAGLRGPSTKYGITSHCKTRHRGSHWGWMRQLSKRKRVPKTGRRVRDCPCSTVKDQKGFLIYVLSYITD